MGIGTPTPDPSAILELSSSNQGLLLPRVGNPATDISSPVAGLTAYNTTTNQIELYDGASWVVLSSGGGDNWGTQVAQSLGPLQGDGTAGNELTFLPGTAAGEVWEWNGSAWQLVNSSTYADNWGTQAALTTGPLTGDGTVSSELNFQPGTAAGEVWEWNGSAWQLVNSSTYADNWGTQTAVTATLLTGDGTSANAIRLQNGTAPDQVPVWDGTAWAIAAAPNDADWEYGAGSIYNLSDSVGIGITPSTAKLDVYSTGNLTAARFDQDGTGRAIDALSNTDVAPTGEFTNNATNGIALAANANDGLAVFANGIGNSQGLNAQTDDGIAIIAQANGTGNALNASVQDATVASLNRLNGSATSPTLLNIDAGNAADEGKIVEISAAGTSGDLMLDINAGGNTIMEVQRDGNIGIGRTPSAARLEVEGTFQLLNGIRVNEIQNAIGVSATPSLTLLNEDAIVNAISDSTAWIEDQDSIYVPAGKKVGIGLNDPPFPLTVIGDSTGGVFYVNTVGAGFNSAVYGEASGSTGDNAGVQGLTLGQGNNNAGVYGSAEGTGTNNVGVYGNAENGTNNFAGYFENGDIIALNGNVGIGLLNPNAPLQLDNSLSNRKIVLTETAPNPHQFNGFGANTNVLRFQVASTAASHVFYAAASPSASNELLRIQGDGNLGIGTNSPQRTLDVNGAGRLLQPLANGRSWEVRNDGGGASPSFTTGRVGIGAMANSGGTEGVYAIQAVSDGTGTGAKYGVYTEASGSGVKYGLNSVVYGAGASNFGVFGSVLGNANINYGLYGSASGSGNNNYGVYGNASGASGNNFGGYFEDSLRVNSGTFSLPGGVSVNGIADSTGLATSPVIIESDQSLLTANAIALAIEDSLSASQSLQWAYEGGNTITGNPPVSVNTRDGFVASGAFGSGVLPTTGAGVRMMWFPRDAAFRVGGVSGTQWDVANIGDYSFATGQDVIASGLNSVAIGQNSVASGDYSIALGRNMQATGDNTFAINLDNNTRTISQDNSLAIMGGPVGIGADFPRGMLDITDGGGAAGRFTVGSAFFSSLDFGTSFVGFNASRSRSSSGNWEIHSDGSNDGGVVMIGSLFGDLRFSNLPTTNGSVTRTVTDTDVMNGTNMILSRDGYLGLGTYGLSTYPSHRLEVNDPATYGDGEGAAYFYGSGNGTNAALRAEANNTGDFNGATIYADAQLAGYGTTPDGLIDYGAWGHKSSSTFPTGAGIVGTYGSTRDGAAIYALLAGNDGTISYAGKFEGADIRLNNGNLGIGLAGNPSFYSLHVQGDGLVESSSTAEPIFSARNTTGIAFTLLTGRVALTGESWVNDFSDKYGVVGRTAGTGGNCFGVYASATGTGTSNTGLYASASGSGTDYAAHFEDGNVWVDNGSLAVGTNAPEAKFDVDGSVAYNIRVVNSGGSIAVVPDDHTVVAEGVAPIFELPDPATAPGRVIYLKHIGTGLGRITTPSGTIDGSPLPYAMDAPAGQEAAYTVQSDGNNWYVISIS